MGTVTIKKQSAASVPNPATDQLRLFIDSSDDILKTKDSLGVVRPSGVGTADELATTGAPVDVSGSAPPVAGGVLTADSAVAASWKAATALYFYGSPVRIVSTVTGPTTHNAAINTLVPVDISAGNVTVNLPTAVGNTDHEVWIKITSLASGNSCTVDGAGSQTIDGSLTAVLNTDYEWIILRSDGANWMQIG